MAGNEIGTLKTNTSNESVKEKINQHFDETWFDGRTDGSYEVKGKGTWETLSWIINEIMIRSQIEKWDRPMIRNLVLVHWKEYNFGVIKAKNIIKVLENGKNQYKLFLTPYWYDINLVTKSFERKGTDESSQEQAFTLQVNWVDSSGNVTVGDPIDINLQKNENENESWIEEYNGWKIINLGGTYKIEIGWEKLYLLMQKEENAKKTIDLVNHIIKVYKDSRNNWQDFFAAEDNQTKWHDNASINLQIHSKPYPGWYLNPGNIWKKWANPTTMLREETFNKAVWEYLDPTRDNNIMQVFASFLNKIKDK